MPWNHLVKIISRRSGSRRQWGRRRGDQIPKSDIVVGLLSSYLLGAYTYHWLSPYFLEYQEKRQNRKGSRTSWKHVITLISILCRFLFFCLMLKLVGFTLQMLKQNSIQISQWQGQDRLHALFVSRCMWTLSEELQDCLLCVTSKPLDRIWQGGILYYIRSAQKLGILSFHSIQFPC